MNDRRRIFEYLVAEAQKVGLAPVKDAANQFLKLGLRAVVVTEKRRAVPRDLVKSAWERQGGRCSICKQPLALDEAEGDHVDPHALGGKLQRKNIVAVHGKKSEINCNAVKGGRDMVSESKRRGDLFNEMLPGD